MNSVEITYPDGQGFNAKIYVNGRDLTSSRDGIGVHKVEVEISCDSIPSVTLHTLVFDKLKFRGNASVRVKLPDTTPAWLLDLFDEEIRRIRQIMEEEEK